MDLKQVLEARALASTTPQTQAAADVSPMMVVQYVPALGTNGTSSRIALVQNSSMTFTVDGAAPAGKDAIGASGVVLTSSSTYDTMGELVDYINGRQAWRAYLVGALRSDASSILLAKSAADAQTATGLTFYADTSQYEGSIVPGTAGAYSVATTAVSGERFVNNGVNGHQKDWESGVENSLHYMEYQLTHAGAGVFRIYSGKAGETEVQLFANNATSTTEYVLGRQGADVLTSGVDDIFVKAPRGHRLVIRAATTTLFTAFTKFSVYGKSAVISGEHMSDTINFTAG